jgi:hypothetical protein
LERWNLPKDHIDYCRRFINWLKKNHGIDYLNKWTLLNIPQEISGPISKLAEKEGE